MEPTVLKRLVLSIATFCTVLHGADVAYTLYC